MMTLTEYIHTALEGAAERIRLNIDAQGINASGRTKASILVRETEKGFALVGGGDKAAPIGTLEIGRKAGKVPSDFETILSEWVAAKGINVADERKFVRSLAWKIKRYGTERHRDPSKRKDIYSSVAVETLENIKNEAKEHLLQTVRAIITKVHFKQS